MDQWSYFEWEWTLLIATIIIYFELFFRYMSNISRGTKGKREKGW